MIEYLVSSVGDSQLKTCADIGSGTGILAQLLVPHFANVFGVEPNLEMRIAGEKFLSDQGNFRSFPGTAEQTGLSDRSVDLVTVAQAFHWFDRAKFRNECKRILRSDGHVALIWNNRLVNTPLLERYEAVLRHYADDYNEVNHQNISAEQLHEFFGGEYERKEFPNKQEFDLQGLFGRLDSSSYAPKPGTKNYGIIRKELTESFKNFSQNGCIDFNYRAELYWGRIKD